MAAKALYALYTINEMERFSWVCRTGGEAFKRRLALSVAVLIAA